MHAALWKLYRLRVRGSLRSIGGKLRSPRGAALAVFTLLVFGAMLGPNLVMAFTLGRQSMAGRSTEGFREVLPVMMLVMVVLNVVTSLGERALYFSPSDVDFLFPAPFQRRQILVYKILGNFTAAVFIALLFPTSLAIYIRSWPAAVVGCFLAWLMINSMTMCAQLIAQTVGERAFTRARKLLLFAVLAAAAAALGQAASQGLDGDWLDALRHARHAYAAEIALAPFVVFAKVIAAERLAPDALGWAALGAAMVVGVYALAIRLDANYLETAARVSRHMQALRRRVAAEGGLAATRSRPCAVRLCRIRRGWAAGPIIWRQSLQALRGSRGAIFMAVIVVTCMGLPMAFSFRRHGAMGVVLPHLVVGMAAYVTILYSAQAPMGFCAD